VLLYYLKLAFRSLRGTPAQTAITLLAIGLGTAVPTATLSIHHLFSQNPIPEKSDRLFNIRMDSWDPNSEFFGIKPGDPPKHITYRDMEGIRSSDIPLYSTGVAMVSTFVFPEGQELAPYQTRIRLCHADFFPMFNVPFQYGGPWDAGADADRERVTVLSQETNQRLFGGENSVGRTLRFGENDFTVIGVLGPFNPTPLYYDVINNQMGPPQDFFIPFDLIRDPSLAFATTGDSDNWGNFTADPDDPDSVFMGSERTWIQYWVELAPERFEPYRDFIDGYTSSQRALGRFARPQNNRVTSLMEWMEVRDVVPKVSIALVWISLLFLLVCSLNLVGLLLSRFLASTPHLGLHRALGASRAEIFAQRLIECELVGILGGLVGLGLAGLALALLEQALPDQLIPAGSFSIDAYTLSVAFVLSLVAGLLSGLYPAWNACKIAPAHQLKLQ
jgi:putative ABC transport system permease protein